MSSTTAVAVPKHHPLQLETAYCNCRHIARKAAKNFYYGFMVLPQRRRDALCAVYAFMRQADDISDEPGLTLAERRQKLSTFLDNFRRAAAGGTTDDPVLMALQDAQQRFSIPTTLLEQLVAGTAMDLQEEFAAGPTQPVVAYKTFDQLYDYCYHVAGVVGLVCIKIFGYTDNTAEPLAEHLGVAFQLTNILRDVKEDAQMGRIYIPQEDLDRFQVSPAELAAGADSAKLQPLLKVEAKRARDFYASGEALLPLIEEVSQPALWVLVEVYRGLLDRIEARNYDVYSERVRVSTFDKIKLLIRGFLKRLA
ncbi:MAG TPA: phytoene/squalene synthase family protein [candidate division Zixibacteria bacterium]|nr:phytoene/squalene synthase family protein [candidate division Zixibacteria bacterium]